MKIVVCVKYCPDAKEDRGFDDDNRADRESVDGVLSELDEYAVEEALKLAESDDAEVVALTVGPEDADQAVRRALQMGADAGYHVLDDAIAGSDAVATSKILAAAVGAVGDVDMVLMGMASTDGEMSVIPSMLSHRLGLPQATFASSLALSGSTVTIERDTDAAREVVEVELPAIISVTDQINEPRYPSFKGIMAAKKKPVTEWDLEDLDLDASEVGASTAWSGVDSVEKRPARTQGVIVTDEGDGADKLVEFLSAGKFV